MRSLLLLYQQQLVCRTPAKTKLYVLTHVLDQAIASNGINAAAPKPAEVKTETTGTVAPPVSAPQSSIPTPSMAPSGPASNIPTVSLTLPSCFWWLS